MTNTNANAAFENLKAQAAQAGDLPPEMAAVLNALLSGERPTPPEAPDLETAADRVGFALVRNSVKNLQQIHDTISQSQDSIDLSRHLVQKLPDNDEKMDVIEKLAEGYQTLQEVFDEQLELLVETFENAEG